MTTTRNSRRPEAKHNFMPSALAIILTVMVSCVVASLMQLPIPADNKDVLVFMVGQLTTAWMIAIGYYYQSTAGSKAKDLLLADSIPVQRNDPN